MSFVTYGESGLRYFLYLSIPALVFLIFYIFCRVKSAKRTKESRAYLLSSNILIVYVFVFFAYMFFGLRFLYLLGR